MEVVGAVIKNAQQEYLLQQRDEYAPSFKHCWTLFGGRVEESESPEAALLRELEEEISLSRQRIQSIELVQTNSDTPGIVQYIFEVITSAFIDELVLSEGEAMAYISETSLFDREFAFNIKEVLEKYLKKNA